MLLDKEFLEEVSKILIEETNISKKIRKPIETFLPFDLIERINNKGYFVKKPPHDEQYFSNQSLQEVLDYIAVSWLVEQIKEKWADICNPRRKNGNSIPKNAGRFGDISKSFLQFSRYDLINMMRTICDLDCLEKKEGLYYIPDNDGIEMGKKEEKIEKIEDLGECNIIDTSSSPEIVFKEDVISSKEKAWEEAEKKMNTEEELEDTKIVKFIDDHEITFHDGKFQFVKKEKKEQQKTHPFVPVFTKKGIFIPYDMLVFKQRDFEELTWDIRWLRKDAVELQKIIEEHYPLTSSKIQHIINYNPPYTIKSVLKLLKKMMDENIPIEEEEMDLENIEILDISEIEDLEENVEIEEEESEEEKPPAEELQKTYVTEITPYPDWLHEELNLISSDNRTTDERLKMVQSYQSYKKSGLEDEEIRKKMNTTEPIEILDLEDDLEESLFEDTKKDGKERSRRNAKDQNAYDHQKNRLRRNCRKNNLDTFQEGRANELFELFYDYFVDNGNVRPNEISPISVYFAVSNGKREPIQKKYNIRKVLLKSAQTFLENVGV